jgi:hypothetical protein
VDVIIRKAGEIALLEGRNHLAYPTPVQGNPIADGRGIGEAATIYLP